MVQAHQDLESKLARLRAESAEHALCLRSEEVEREREALELSREAKDKVAKLDAEEEERLRQLEERLRQLEEESARIKAAYEEERSRIKKEEQQRVLQLREAAARSKAGAEEEAWRRKTEEDEIVRAKLSWEELMSRVQVVVPFSSVLNTSSLSSGLASPRSNLAPKTTSPRSATREAPVTMASAALPQDMSTVKDWLRSISLQQYSEAIKEYGYDSLKALDAALQADLEEMTNDPAVAMKKPHRRLLIEQWQQRQKRT